MDGFSQFLEIAESADVIPVVETMPADLLTPLGVYLKLSENTPNSFLLESVEGGVNLARHSFIGADAIEVIRDDDAEGPAFARLRKLFTGQKVFADAELPPFTGGVVGFMGFNCSSWFEPPLKRNSQTESDAAFMVFHSTVAFDHAKQVIKIITLAFPDRSGKAALRTLYDEAVEKNRRIKKLLEDAPVVPDGTAHPTSTAEITSNWTRTAFEKAVVQIKDLIAAGECYQVVLSQCFTKPTAASPVSIYRALRSLNPSPYMFLIRLNKRAIVGASPEMLVRCEDDRLEYRPIAGTRPRGAASAEDEALAEDMRNDAKEVAEHMMLVDLGRNDLGRVAQYGSVRVDSLMRVEKYSHVQHLASSLSARLRDGFDRFDALAACFPAGTVSGAPKVRAMEIIRDLEPTARGVYAGAVGYFDYGGNMDTCIAIRTLTLEGGVVRIQAGAGIVADSVPAWEFEETVNKAKALLRAVEIAEGRGL